MRFLVFQLQAPLASWGDAAVGEYRGSRDHPGESALLGLLGAALGLKRDDETAHAALRDGLAFAVGVVAADPQDDSPGAGGQRLAALPGLDGGLLRDYHTAQVPGRTALKGRPHATRRDELALPKEALNTVLSTRDYRQDVAYVVAVQSRGDGAPPLDALADALRRPRFVLYLGRKSCPPAAPLDPWVLEAPSAREAIDTHLLRRAPARESAGVPALRLVRLAWGDGIDAPGAQAHLSVPRKDRPIRRRAWQFGDRTEHVALLAQEP